MSEIPDPYQVTHWKIALGSTVRCKYTGFTGVVDQRAEHLNGCHRYSVQPKVAIKEGKMEMPNGYWFDEVSLEVLPGEPVITHKPRTEGGPITRSYR